MEAEKKMTWEEKTELKIRVRNGNSWRKCSKWQGCRDYQNPEALYYGCIMYQIGYEQGMKRRSKNEWLYESEYQEQNKKEQPK